MANKLIQLKHGNDNIYPTQYDTGWINVDIDSNIFENFSWEPLAYRRIGVIVYIHGGGKILQNLTHATHLGLGLPKPRQNTPIVAIQNAQPNTFNFLVTYEGYLNIVGNRTSGDEFIINGSYITRE